jgi:hypothetical protein
MLSYKDFLKVAEECNNCWLPDDETIHIEWRTGGMEGGSCWGDIAEPIGAEDEPEFEVLDKILENVCPQIGLFQHKILLREVITEDHPTEREYYGNVTHRTRKTVKLKDLYKWLKTNNLLS